MARARKTPDGSVVAALERELESMPAVMGSALARAAVALARELDDPANSATSKSMCGKALLDMTNKLRELQPPVVVDSPVDEIRERRQKRLAKADR